MSKRRRRPATSQTGRYPHPPTTTDADSPEETAPSDSSLANPDSTTWQEPIEEELTAPVKLPTPESMTVQLGPVNLIERLDEYQSDENIAYTLVGLFTGAALGILGNWAVNAGSPITGVSVVLVVVFILLSVGIGFWLWRIRKRKIAVRNRIVGK